MVVCLCLLLLGLLPALAHAQAACTHYASPQGTGNGLSPTTPFKVQQFWAVAAPGSTLCLLDGTYTGSASIIEPPTTLHGTPTQPITIRALNDGEVLLDGQGHWVLRLRGDWFVVEGVNARNGGEFLLAVGGSHNRVRRTIGWDGTSGESNSNIWYVWGVDTIVEDCAGWGNNSRKIFNGSQAGDVGGSGFRRCWGEWNDHPQGPSQPHNTYQVGYNSWNQLFENVIGTWNATGQVSEAQSVLEVGQNCAGEQGGAGTRVLGAILYLPPGAQRPPGAIVGAWCAQTVRDVVAVAAPGFPGLPPFFFGRGAGTKTCENCLSIHSGTPSRWQGNHGWNLLNFREGNGLAAATGGVSAFELLPGICKRYVGGQLTNDPLWPWPMDARIREARALSGTPPLTVTAEIEKLLGPIPAACRLSRNNEGGGPTLNISATSVSVGGTVTVSWSGVASPTSTDWISVYVPGASDLEYGYWLYASSCTQSPGAPQASGSCTFPMSSIGTFEFRLFTNDSFNRLATSPGIVKLLTILPQP